MEMSDLYGDCYHCSFSFMEGRESVLESLFDEESGDDAQDVAMLDVEEGELTEHFSKARLVESCGVDINQANQESGQRSSRNKKKKRKSKRKRSSSVGSNITDINRFVLDVCKRLREKKHYLVWNAVGCLGVAALNDLVKEVDAIQACGGQKTADGRRSRTGGGILWNIIKSRDPNAYKEIMKKGKEFENQFKQQLRSKQNPTQQKPTNDSSQNLCQGANQVIANPSNVFELPPYSHDRSQHEESNAGKPRMSVHSRIRVPVTYDDLLNGDDLKNDANQPDPLIIS